MDRAIACGFLAAVLIVAGLLLMGYAVVDAYKDHRRR